MMSGEVGISQGRPARAGTRYVGPHHGEEPIEVTVVLRRRGGAPASAGWPQPPAVSHHAFPNLCGADPADIARLREFTAAHGLQETGCQPHRRVLHVRGSSTALQRAFGVQLGSYQSVEGGPMLLGCAGAPTLPDGVIAVLGLDRRPIAAPHVRQPHAQPSHTYTPIQLGQLYGFPAGTDGSGQTVAVIELGGGYRTNDLETYFTSLGLTTMPSVTAVSVVGGLNLPGRPADTEVMLDIEVLGALAPAAAIVVYFAPNTDQGFYEAISQAIHDSAHKPSVISISWGAPEPTWSNQALAAMQTALQDAALLGVTVTASAGDNGSSDGDNDGTPHVDFPASSPYALACGGTTLIAGGDTISNETVWNDTTLGQGATGGGVSVDFAIPDWQHAVTVPTTPDGSAGRGVPDVAGNADPLTGYQVCVDGTDQVLGGTSAVAPLWAALVARLNQQLGRPLGDPHRALYQIGSSAFRDITIGTNGVYTASPGWDPCTGLGSPNGQALLTALTALSADPGNSSEQSE
ncbi:S8 family serine peptidase [Mycobacterium sp. M1]|uniref:S8 family serine peptidase n=1 Tax=Mycolicibacter acidiphilus TaxID=2835306 RepID=A0ABS5RID5_9MYCO|nr:S53 family peptidase [Mycolicibacter acidiphilus]MBS9534061.1 S8 family serine peptidase [Mycolicibacter acidiphilus]